MVGLRSLAAKLEKLQGQIAATERGLASARTEVAQADAGLSVTANQSTLYAKWFRWTSDPDFATVQTANEGMGIAMAFVLAIAACGLSLAGAWPHLVGVQELTRSASAGAARAEPNSQQPILPIAAPAPAPAASTNTFQINGDPIEALRQIAQHIQSKQVPA